MDRRDLWRQKQRQQERGAGGDVSNVGVEGEATRRGGRASWGRQMRGGSREQRSSVVVLGGVMMVGAMAGAASTAELGLVRDSPASGWDRL
jgi:hypothetical protein